LTQNRITAAALIIGDEILSGRTKDRNIGAIADGLAGHGIDLTEVRIVADDEAAIVEAVNALRARNAYLFTTGGIGPTHDDITPDAIAKALGVPIDIDPRARALMQAECDRRGIELNAARLRMARLPKGADLVEADNSIAPGFMIGNIVVMAGVPPIMEKMLAAVLPRLRSGPRRLSWSLTLDEPEGAIAGLFAECQQAFPDVAMGSYPFKRDGRPGTELVLRTTSAERLEAAAADLQARIRAHPSGTKR
jgi:molybdopterin-biosynthesis enzyme MoeA-like protein